MLGAAEVAVILGCSTKAVERMRDRGTDSLPLHWGSRGRRRVVSIVALANWLDGLCEPPSIDSSQPRPSRQRKEKTKTQVASQPQPSRQRKERAKTQDALVLNQPKESWVRRPSLLNSITALNRCFITASQNEFWTDVASEMINALVHDDTGHRVALAYLGAPQLPDLLPVAEKASPKAWLGLADWWKPGDPVEEAISYLKAPSSS